MATVHLQSISKHRERYKIGIGDILLVFSRTDQHFEDLVNVFKVLIKSGLKVSSHKGQFLKII